MLDRVECMFLSTLPPAPTPEVQTQVNMLHQVARHPDAFRLCNFYFPADYRLFAKHALLNKYYDDAKVGSIESINMSDFVTELLEAIREGNWVTAMNHYSIPDILVIDDVQLISGKQSTEECFYLHVLKRRLEEKKLTILFSEESYEALSVTLRDDLRNLLRLGFHDECL